MAGDMTTTGFVDRRHPVLSVSTRMWVQSGTAKRAEEERLSTLPSVSSGLVVIAHDCMLVCMHVCCGVQAWSVKARSRTLHGRSSPDGLALLDRVCSHPPVIRIYRWVGGSVGRSAGRDTSR